MELPRGQPLGIPLQENNPSGQKKEEKLRGSRNVDIPLVPMGREYLRQTLLPGPLEERKEKIL